MNRISKCLRFQLKNMLKSTLWFLIIYCLAAYGLSLLTYILSGGAQNTFKSGLSIGAAFYIFVYVISDYRTTFNYLMINGNTRTTIYISNIIANIILSVAMSILSYLSGFADAFFTKALSGIIPGQISILQFIYPGSVGVLELPYLAALFILITAFSKLYGVLNYKFGKYFVTIFWVGFGLAVISLPLSGSDSFLKIGTIIEKYLWLGHPNGVLLAQASFIITALVFGAAAYLVSRRQPQTEPVS